MNDSDKTTAMSNGDSSTSGASVEPECVVPEVLPMDDEGNPTHKIKGAAQIAAGTALTAAGVPMLVLPGPGAVAIAGGAALISKGQRNCSGRSATPFEENSMTLLKGRPSRLKPPPRKQLTKQPKRPQRLRRRLFAKRHLLLEWRSGQQSLSLKALPVQWPRRQSPLRKALRGRRWLRVVS